MSSTAITLVRDRLRVPLYRNGYALVASSALTSGLGLVYWLVAARLYSAEALGVCAGVISAMTLLANIAQLNLKGALNRFLPTAGAESARMTLRAYGVALVLSALAAVIFLAGTGQWSPELGFLSDRAGLALWFVAATMAWTIWVLQDSVLAGIRQAGLVPVENFVFSAVKIVLLVVLVAAAPDLGVFLSWSLPVVALILPFNLIVFRRLIPAHVRATRGRDRQVSTRSMAGYVAGDSVAYAMWSVTIGVLPLVVLHLTGAEANAQYFVSWSIAYSLYLVSSGMGQSLLAEASVDPDGLDQHARRTLVETMRIVVPGAAVVVVCAPAVLGLLAGRYAEEATDTLRLLALSAVPYVMVSVGVNVARAERRMRYVVLVYGSLCVLVVALGLPLLAAHGIEGLGLAWLAAQAVVAAGVLVHRAWRPRSRRTLAPVLRALGREDPWVIAADLPTDGTVTVSAVGPRGSPPQALVKVARGARAAARLDRQELALMTLHAHPGIARLRRLVPRALASGRLRGRAFLVESALPGTAADAALSAGMPMDRFMSNAERAMRPMHRATAQPVTVDEALLEEWVDAPLERLRGVARDPSALAEIGAELHAALAGRRLKVGFAHGDLWAGNVLLDADGAVTGIVDWEDLWVRGLARVDLMHLLITTRALIERRELGDVVAELLSGPFARGTSDRDLVLLAWLHHAAANRDKCEHAARRRLWARRNVDPVLAAVAPAPVSARRALDLPRVASAAVLAAAIGLWVVALGGIEPRAMTDLGLVSVLPVGFVAAALALGAGFAAAAHARVLRPGLLLAHLVALVTLLHATPALVYGTLRYSWAWKHVGIVDYIQRHGAVTPGIDQLPVYHNWPGFFGLDALLTGLAGLPDAVGQAIWAPLLFNLLTLGALVFVLTALTPRRRVVWLACWLYFVANWVGQDYFAPQTLTLFLYLMVIGVAVRWLRDRVRPAALALALALVAAIAVSHPLTAVMTTLALAALVLCRACAARWLPVLAGGLVVGWNLTFAAPFVSARVGSVLESVRLPWAVTEESLASTSVLSEGQAVVALAGRALVLAVAAVAAVGVVRLYRARRLDRVAPVLAVAPVALFGAGDYDGEMIFRIYLFALPFLAFLAANAFSGRGARSALAFGVTATLMLGAFSLAHYGKDRQYAFTREEVAAARWLYAHAPPGSLLIEGTRSYPGQAAGYENFRYVTIAREPSTSFARFLADPAAVFSEWIADPAHPAAFLIITRAMKAEVDAVGAMPVGSLATIERALRVSPRVSIVYENRDAVVFGRAEAIATGGSGLAP